MVHTMRVPSVELFFLLYVVLCTWFVALATRARP